MMMTFTAMPKYEAYKDSGVEWIGEIPEHWSLLKLKLIVKEHSGNGFPVELQGKEGEIPFLKVSDIGGSGVFVENSANRVTFSVIKKNKWNVVPSGSLVTAKIGEALRKNHRKILKENSIIDNNCIAFECKHITLKFNYYLHLVLNFDWFVNPGAVPSISVGKYKSEKVIVPPQIEQMAIANFLDEKTAKIDEAIAIKEKQIELLKERKQIIIQLAVTQGLDLTVPMKDSGVDWMGQIPAHWDIENSKWLFSLRREKAKKDDVQLTASQKYGVIPQQLFMELEGRRVTQVEFNSEILKHVESGDFVISMRSFQGGIEYCSYIGSVSSAYVALIPTDKIYSPFFKYLLKCNRYIEALQSTSNLVRDGQALRYENFCMVPLPVIPIKEQVAISNYIDQQIIKIESAVELLFGQVITLKEYRTTLINSAVTGKIKVV